MKFLINENSTIDPAELKQVLIDELGLKYKITNRKEWLLVIAKDQIIGATVLVTKNKISVTGNFSTLKAQFVFMILFVGLGFILPLLIYLLVFHKKMKNVEKEVSDFIKIKYKDKIHY